MARHADSKRTAAAKQKTLSRRKVRAEKYAPTRITL